MVIINNYKYSKNELDWVIGAAELPISEEGSTTISF